MSERGLKVILTLAAVLVIAAAARNNAVYREHDHGHRIGTRPIARSGHLWLSGPLP